MSNSPLPDPPYPNTTKAGSLSLDIQVGRLMNSDTWVMMDPEIRPWWVMTFVVSWAQHPCGAFKNNPDLIAAKLGCDLRFFEKHRDEILAGWELHSDGRLYHPVLSERVHGIVDWRKREAEKKEKARARLAEKRVREAERAALLESPANGNNDLPKMSPGTPQGVPEESPGSPLYSLSLSSSSSSSSKDKETPPSEGKRKTGSRFTLTQLPDDWREFCLETRDDLDPDGTFDEFRDYWISVPGQRGSKLDWKATWRNWVRSQRRGRSSRSGAPAPSSEVIKRFLEREKSETIDGECEVVGGPKSLDLSALAETRPAPVVDLSPPSAPSQRTSPEETTAIRKKLEEVRANIE